MMEHFLERVSLSSYQDNFILKGGMLVASIVGVDMRATMDIDTTVRILPLNDEDAGRIITEICNIPVEDGVSFTITSIKSIMDDFKYPGIRMMIEATLERMRQAIKIDISTDDVITPKAVEYEYHLMFENRAIKLFTYNLETLLAEKTQTILARGIANTRLRDFYDVYEIMKRKEGSVDTAVLKEAFGATCEKRETVFTAEQMNHILQVIETDSGLEEMWNRFRDGNYFVGELKWSEVSKYDIEVMKKYLCP